MNIPKLLKKLPSCNKINYTINNLIDSVEYLYESGSGGGGIVYQAGQGIEISGSTISLNASGETYLRDTICFTTGSQNPTIRLGTSDVEGYLNSIDLHTYSYGKVEIDIPETFHLINTAKNGSGYINIGGSNIKNVNIGGIDYDYINIKATGAGYVTIGNSGLQGINLYGSTINLSGSVYLNGSKLTVVDLQPNGNLYIGGSQTSGISIGTGNTGSITIGYTGRVIIASGGGNVNIGSNISITGGAINIATGGEALHLGGAIDISGSVVTNFNGSGINYLYLGNENSYGYLNFGSLWFNNKYLCMSGSGSVLIDVGNIDVGYYATKRVSIEAALSGRISIGSMTDEVRVGNIGSLYLKGEHVDLESQNVFIGHGSTSITISGGTLYIKDSNSNSYKFSGGSFVQVTS